MKKSILMVLAVTTFTQAGFAQTATTGQAGSETKIQKKLSYVDLITVESQMQEMLTSGTLTDAKLDSLKHSISAMPLEKRLAFIDESLFAVSILKKRLQSGIQQEPLVVMTSLIAMAVGVMGLINGSAEALGGSRTGAKVAVISGLTTVAGVAALLADGSRTEKQNKQIGTIANQINQSLIALRAATLNQMAAESL